MNDERRQTYPSTSGDGGIDVISDPDDCDLRIDTSASDSLYLSRNQVRCLMHQLTDWLT